MIWIGHGLYDVVFDKVLYRDSFMRIVPDKFYNLLVEKAEKWKNKGFKYNLIPFTFATDTKHDIWAISILHPWDEFNKEVGEDIVVGRIARQRGELAPQRWEYNRLVKEEPPYMICHDIKLGDLTIAQCEMGNNTLEEKHYCSCKGCGEEMNPVQVMLSATHGKCGECVDKEVEKLK